MKKVIRLTESDLTRIVKRVINENKKKPSNEKIEDVLKKLMDDYIGEDEWKGGYRESSDKPYDRFMVRFNQSGDDTEEIAEEIIEKLNSEFESNLFKLGNASKNSFWFYIKENDDYKDRSMYDPYYGDDDSYEEDEDLGSTDKGEEKLQDLIEEARDILENELGFSIDEINEMSEREIVECLFDEGYDEIASEMEELLDQEGF